MRQPQKPGQGGTGPRRDDIESAGRGAFHPGIDHLHPHAHPRRRCVKKGAFLGPCLEQGDGNSGLQCRQHQAGKARARPQIGQGGGAIRQMAGKLGAIPHMAAPQVIQTGAGDKIMAAVPVTQNVRIGFQARQCFT